MNSWPFRWCIVFVFFMGLASEVVCVTHLNHMNLINDSLTMKDISCQKNANESMWNFCRYYCWWETSLSTCLALILSQLWVLYPSFHVNLSKLQLFTFDDYLSSWKKICICTLYLQALLFTHAEEAFLMQASDNSFPYQNLCESCEWSMHWVVDNLVDWYRERSCHHMMPIANPLGLMLEVLGRCKALIYLAELVSNIYLFLLPFAPPFSSSLHFSLLLFL